MHSPETRQKFIELRADAHSIPHIASLLGVAQSTLRLWEKDDALEIAHLRCSYWQDAEDKVGITIEHRLRRMAAWIKGAEDELEKRHFDLMNNRDLMRFLREARREYFRLRAMLFNAPGARASSPAATTAKSKTAKPNQTPASRDDIPPINTPRQRGEPEQPHDPPTASAVSPSESATDKIDKIGELADFPKTQPRNTNNLQQPKSSSADFTEPLALVADEVTSQLTSPNPLANPEPPSAYAASDPVPAEGGRAGAPPPAASPSSLPAQPEPQPPI